METRTCKSEWAKRGLEVLYQSVSESKFVDIQQVNIVMGKKLKAS